MSCKIFRIFQKSSDFLFANLIKVRGVGFEPTNALLLCFLNIVGHKGNYAKPRYKEN
jgi:hypothetical protein